MKKIRSTVFYSTGFKGLYWRRRYSVFIILSIWVQTSASAQEQGPERLLPYTHVVRALNEALIFNVRGYEIIVDRAAGRFPKTYLSKMFPGFNLYVIDKPLPDSSLGIPALRLEKRWSRNKTGPYSVYYFLPVTADTVLGIFISNYKLPDKALERELADLVLHSTIPDSLISYLNPPVVLLAGRSIPVNMHCLWAGANVMQCTGLGEMNWSLHPDMEEARSQTEAQEATNRDIKQFTVEQEEEVPVVFEGVPVTARRLRLHAKGVKGLLMKKMEGSRTLIVYYITAPVRGRYVSCVLSYWTSDYITESGLPPLLETVMQLK